MLRETRKQGRVLRETRKQGRVLRETRTTGRREGPFQLFNFRLYFYVVGEAIQLAGYITLLATFIMVLSHGRKKNKG